jgi:glycosyltransferase involved in cell wall biosynthesis
VLAPEHLAKRLLVRRIHAAIAITDRTAEEVRHLGFRGPVWQIPNHRPVGSTEALAPGAGCALRAELGVPAAAPVVTTVGHLVPQKDPAAAVAVFAAVAAQLPEAHFLVAGDGPLRGRAEAQAAECVAPGRVHFLGHRADVSRILAASDIVLSTSRADSMPGTVIEAQLAGCPVVAFPVDGIGEVVLNGRTGVVTDRPDPAEAAAAVVSLLRDPERRLAMAAAAAPAAQHLTTARVVPRYKAILAAVARTGGAGDPLRVLHVLPDLGVGGAERALQVLATTGPVDGSVAQLVAVVGGARRPLAETVHGSLQEAGVGYCDLGVRRRPSRSVVGLVQAAWRLQRVARRLGVDVVDAALLDASLPARVAPGRFRRVTHLVNTPYADSVGQIAGGSPWRRRFVREIDALTSRRDDALVALTAAVADAAASEVRLGRGATVRVIPRGVDVDAFAPTAQARDGCHVVSVGRLVPQKGHDTLIRAVAAARAAGHPLRLSIAGEGPLHDELEDLTQRLQVDGPVQLLGPVADVRGLLAACGIFALASRWEGQSNAVLEAMAMACPVVVGDVPALREVVADAGLLVAADDVAAWSEALVALTGDPTARTDMGSAARERAASCFDARRRSAELLSLHRELRDRPRGQRWRP